MQIMLCRAVAREDSFGTAADATESRWLERGKCRDSRGVDTGLVGNRAKKVSASKLLQLADSPPWGTSFFPSLLIILHCS